MPDTSKFDQNDWDHLHDVIIDVTGKNLGRPELEVFFATLPEALQLDAYRWGMSDTVWGDAVYTYLNSPSVIVHEPLTANTVLLEKLHRGVTETRVAQQAEPSPEEPKPRNVLGWIEENYADLFRKGVPFAYTEHELSLKGQCVRANPDGSEDLMQYNNSLNHTFIEQRCGPGEGKYAQLRPQPSP